MRPAPVGVRGPLKVLTIFDVITESELLMLLSSFKKGSRGSGLGSLQGRVGAGKVKQWEVFLQGVVAGITSVGFFGVEVRQCEKILRRQKSGRYQKKGGSLSSGWLTGTRSHGD